MAFFPPDNLLGLTNSTLYHHSYDISNVQNYAIHSSFNNRISFSLGGRIRGGGGFPVDHCNVHSNISQGKMYTTTCSEVDRKCLSYAGVKSLS